MEKDRSGIMLYLDKEDIEMLDNFVKANKRLFNNRQSVFRYMVNNLDELASISTLVTHTDTLKLREAEKELAVMKEKNNGLEKEKELLENLKRMEETIDVIEVVVSSDFLLTNEIKGSKNTKTYNQALRKVKLRKEYPNGDSRNVLAENDESEREKMKKILDSW